ncbi:MAG: gliding motility-associated C-terminal domain-containing protein, partial [Bacteroidia bacterium]|nr:gliding motility-associated C-terminal domain-containing protein [Bacteroidia bacterium]
DTFGALYVDVMAYRLEIFNRWGEKLFTSTDPNLGWDGSFKGEVAQDDLYTYRLRFTLNSGKEGFRVGRVLLLK